MEFKWICNRCGEETLEQPEGKNSTCVVCKKGRYQYWVKCNCGKWFHPSKLKAKYCSPECRVKYMPKGNKKGKHYPHLQRVRIAECPVCGKEFRAVRDSKNSKQVYCSKTCFYKSKRGKIVKKCEQCGAEFESYEYRNQKYCSHACRNMAYRKLTGELSHCWRGGKTKIADRLKTSSEYREWRASVFDRDNYTCQECGKTNCYLEAHHIKEKSNYPELIFDVDNGVTLCHECHKKTDNYANKAKQFTGGKAELVYREGQK